MATKNIYLVYDNGNAELKCANSTILIDSDCVDRISKYQWSVGKHGYATHGAGKNQILLHRFIVGAIGSDIVDHINHNKLDNRKSNLRICNNQQNTMNRGKQSNGKNDYKGICLTSDGRWQAQIGYDGESIYLGLYDDPETAAKAYDHAARMFFGNYAYLNFPNCTDAIKKEIKHFKKLTEIDVQNIRHLYKHGVTVSELADMYEHSYSAISRIIKNKTFRREAARR